MVRSFGFLLGFAFILTAAGFVLVVIGREAVYTGWGFRGFTSLLAIPFSITGIFILHRLPRHGIGWVFLVLGWPG